MKNRSLDASPRDPARSETLTIPRRWLYRFLPDAPCPFCGTTPTAVELDVDLNPPFLDFFLVRDRSVVGLPCCSPCAVRYRRREARDTGLPAILAYPASLLHRLSYARRVRRWLTQYARRESGGPLTSGKTGTLRRSMQRRAAGTLLQSLGAILAGCALSRFCAHTTAVPWWMDIVACAAIAWGQVGIVVGGVRWLKWTLAL